MCFSLSLFLARLVASTLSTARQCGNWQKSEYALELFVDCRSNEPQEFQNYLRSSESRSELVSNRPELATAMNGVNGNWPIIIGSEAAPIFA